MPRSSPKRLYINQGQESSVLKSHLFELYRATREYENHVAQDLRPLWKNAGSPDDLFSMALFAERITPEGAVGAYVDAVFRFVKERLRLWEGRDFLEFRGMTGQHVPADWAIHQVDFDVRIWPEKSATGTLSSAKLEFANLRIEMTPRGATVAMIATDHVEDERRLYDHESNVDIDAVRQTAHQMIDAWLSDVAGRFRVEYEQRNTGTMEAQIRDLPMLFDYLYRKKVPDEAGWKRIKRLAERSDLTLPPKRDKKVPKKR